MRKILLIFLMLIGSYLIYFYYFAENAEITVNTAKQIALGSAYMEYGDKEYSLDSHVGLFKESRYLIEKGTPFYLKYQKKSYYRVMVHYPNDPALTKSKGDQISIIYTIDGRNGNVIGRTSSSNP